METLPAQSFFDIHENLRHLMGQIEAQDGEMTDEQEIALGELEIAAEAKVAGVGAWIKSLEMGEAGLESLQKQVKEALGKNRSLHDRLKKWIWKCAQTAGWLKQDETGKWEGRKIQSGQISISWRNSKATVEKPQETGYDKLSENFPYLFKREIVVTPNGWAILKDLIETGDVEVRKCELSKSTAEKYLKAGTVGISGLAIENRVNPIIKVG